MKEDHSIAAGLLMFRKQDNRYEFFLTHPGGPFFRNKDQGVWSIPKGLPLSGENFLDAAIREFHEETGLKSTPPYFPLDITKQKGGKVVHAWAFRGDWSSKDGIKSNTFELEWPPKSGRVQNFPEQDKAAWLSYQDALDKINPAQIIFLDRLLKLDPLK